MQIPPDVEDDEEEYEDEEDAASEDFDEEEDEVAVGGSVAAGTSLHMGFTALLQPGTHCNLLACAQAILCSGLRLGAFDNNFEHRSHATCHFACNVHSATAGIKLDLAHVCYLGNSAWLVLQLYNQ